jgi:hypothetical protein
MPPAGQRLPAGSLVTSNRMTAGLSELSSAMRIGSWGALGLTRGASPSPTLQAPLAVTDTRRRPTRSPGSRRFTQKVAANGGNRFMTLLIGSIGSDGVGTLHSLTVRIRMVGAAPGLRHDRGHAAVAEWRPDAAAVSHEISGLLAPAERLAPAWGASTLRPIQSKYKIVSG